MRPTDLPGFQLLSPAEAEARARELGYRGPFRVPSATQLPDGAALVAVDAPAVTLARVAPGCVAALRGAGDARRALAAATAALARKPSLQRGAAALAALRATPDLGACDAALAGLARSVAGQLLKRESAQRARQSAEASYAQHLQQYQALMRDLEALRSVLALDARAVQAARAKEQQRLERGAAPLAEAASNLAARLLQLEDVAARLR